MTPRLSHLPYYTTTTTTLHTTLSATISQVIHLSFPSAPSGNGDHTLYTLPPLPTSADGKAWVEPLPIAVVTQLEAVIVDEGTAGRHKGQVLSTITTFASPPDVTASPAGGGGAAAGDGGGGGSEVRTDVDNSWGHWTGAQKGGVVAAVVIVGVLSLGMVLWCLFRKGVWGRRGEEKRRSGSSGKRLTGWSGKKSEEQEEEEVEDKTEKNITRIDKGQVGLLTKEVILGMGSSRGSLSRPRGLKDIEADAVNPQSYRSMTVEVSRQSPRSAHGPHHMNSGLPHSPSFRSQVPAVHLQRPTLERRLTPVKENDDAEEDTKRLSLYRRWRLQNKRASRA